MKRCGAQENKFWWDCKINNRTLIDVRSPSEFAGQSSRASRKGHIPGAINQPRGTLVNDDHTMRSPQELQTIFSKQGSRQ